WGDSMRLATILAILAAVALRCTAALAQTCSGMAVGQLTTLNGFVPFQGTSSLWNQDISALQPDPNSNNIINFIGSTVTLHPDFGPGTYNRQSIGIPYQIVAGSQLKVPIIFGLYPDRAIPGRCRFRPMR